MSEIGAEGGLVFHEPAAEEPSLHKLENEASVAAWNEIRASLLVAAT